MTDKERFEEFAKKVLELLRDAKRIEYRDSCSPSNVWWHGENASKYGALGLYYFGPNDLEYRRQKPWQIPGENTPVDAKVWFIDNNEWFRGHFAQFFGEGKFQIFIHGKTSWGSNGSAFTAKYCVLADTDNPTRKPDDDWRPE